MDDTQDHYPDCRAVQTRSADRGPCNCDAIRDEEEDYYSEPADMAARENGFIN